MPRKKLDALFNSTIATLDGGLDTISPKSGETLIKEWITALKKEEGTDAITESLQELHDVLGGNEPDMKAIHVTIKKLIDETVKVAKTTDDEHKDMLKNLMGALKELNKEVK